MEKEYKFSDLTPKQQTLMRLLLPQVFTEDKTAKPKSKAAAYREAYPDSKGKTPEIEVQKMINNAGGKYPKFSLIYAQAKEEAKRIAEDQYKEVIMSSAELFANVSEIARDTENGVSDRIRAHELMARLLGLMNNKVTVDGALPVLFVGEDQLEE